MTATLTQEEWEEYQSLKAQLKKKVEESENEIYDSFIVALEKMSQENRFCHTYDLLETFKQLKSNRQFQRSKYAETH